MLISGDESNSSITVSEKKVFRCFEKSVASHSGWCLADACHNRYMPLESSSAAMLVLGLWDLGRRATAQSTRDQNRKLPLFMDSPVTLKMGHSIAALNHTPTTWWMTKTLFLLSSTFVAKRAPQDAPPAQWTQKTKESSKYQHSSPSSTNTQYCLWLPMPLQTHVQEGNQCQTCQTYSCRVPGNASGCCCFAGRLSWRWRRGSETAAPGPAPCAWNSDQRNMPNSATG